MYLYTRDDGLNSQLAGVKKIKKKDEGIKMLFVGDVMLDRGVRNAIRREGPHYPFSGVRGLFSGNDLVVGNLEGTFTDEPSISEKDNSVLRFTFDPSLASMLKEFGFSGVSLANNHTLDFGRRGYESTQRSLDEQGIFHFGSPLNDRNLSVQISVNGEKICFIGYHGLFESDISPVVAELGRLVECGYKIVFAHWGDEYVDENEEQKRIGRAFIDAGADLVIGHHPHIVQSVDVYKGRAVFYSLGNFLFDQDFSVETRQGLAIRLELTEEEERFELIPVEMSRARLYLPDEPPVRQATTTRQFVLPRP